MKTIILSQRFEKIYFFVILVYASFIFQSISFQHTVKLSLFASFVPLKRLYISPEVNFGEKRGLIR